MNVTRWLASAIALAAAGNAARASDLTLCEKNMICASAPRTIADALVKAGYKADLGKDKNGDPMIESEISGYSYTIYFYGCTENNLCDSLQFYASFDDPITNGIDFANRWNTQKRWVQMAWEQDKYIRMSYDVTTVGGLTPENFADVVSWWETVLGELPEFFDKHAVKRK